mgnify:FL=1
MLCLPLRLQKNFVLHSMQEQKFEVSDVFNTSFEKEYEKYASNIRLLKVAHHIMSCRTKEMGAFVYKCEDCEHESISYCSCRDRMCPKCQSQSHHEWISKIEKVVLDCIHLHAVVTVPSELNPIALANKELFYTLLFQTVSEAVLTLCHNPKHLGATPGMTAILHTWGQKLDFHPHIHMAITAGGVDDENNWVDAKRTKKGDVYLFPVKALSLIVKKRLLKKLRHVEKIGLIEFNHDKFTSLLKEADGKKWISYVKEPFKGSKGVFAYIGNYTHRSAISNSRIKNVTESHTTFQYRDYADKNKQKMLTLANREFIRRFLFHTLKRGFVRIRHYGIYSVPNRRTKLVKARESLNKDSQQRFAEKSDNKKEEKFVLRCPCCGGIMRKDSVRPIYNRMYINYIHNKSSL